MGFTELLTPLQRRILCSIRVAGPAGRSELAERLQARPNSVGQAVADLLGRQMLIGQTGFGERAGVGRPRLPLAIAAGPRSVLGVSADAAGGAQLRPVGLTGRALGPAWRSAIDETPVAVGRALNPDVLGVAVAVPGLIAPHQKGVEAPTGPAWLDGVREASARAGVPVIVGNDGHALAARWSLTRRSAAADEAVSLPDATEEVLLIRIGDGAMGASVLIDGRPNRGCVIGGNELGHTRLPVDTPRCTCGHTGCLERVASTEFLHRRGASTVRTLVELCSAFPGGVGGDDAAVVEMAELLGIGVSNAVQLLRPHRVVWVSELSRFEGFRAALENAVRDRLLPLLRARVAFEAWDEPLSSPAESAAYLGLAAVYDEAWATE